MILVVQKHFDKLEAQRKQILDDVRALRPEQQTYRPEPTAWSILEVFDHLMMIEINSLRYMLKKIQGVDDIEKADVFAGFRSSALSFFLKLPIKYKAPPTAEIVRRDFYEFEEMEKEWNEVRTQWSEFLDHFDSPTAEKLIFKHPMMGKLNIIQAIDFIHDHFEHHIRQIERIKAHVDYPE